MIVGALDLATASGWAVDAEGGGRPILGTYTLPDVARGHAFLAFQNWLFDWLVEHSVERLAVEKPLFGGGSPAHAAKVMKLVGMAAMAESAAASRGILSDLVHVATIRKYFCGNGKAKKAEVMARCTMFGWDFQGDNNQADAAALWAYTKATHDRSFNLETGPLLAAAR
tara:strand:- start:294 stop:800 length:507 start_codon:yes stop_codon:yes gene_type:complete